MNKIKETKTYLDAFKKRNFDRPDEWDQLKAN